MAVISLNLLRPSALLIVLLLELSACASAPDEPKTSPTATKDVQAAPWPRYSWRLPKTVLTATVTFTLTGCAYQNETTQPLTKVAVALKQTAVPDTYLGPDLPTGWVTVRGDRLLSFWNTTAITVETDPATHILTHLVSAPVNQGPTIVGTAITATTKIAASALGVPSSAGAAPPSNLPACLNVDSVNKDIVNDMAALAALAGQTSDAAMARQADLKKKISDETNKITISISCDIDPGITPTGMPIGANCPATPATMPGQDQNLDLPADGRMAVIALTRKDVAKTSWITGFDPDKTLIDLTDQQIGLYLDFANAYPEEVAKCPPDGTSSTCPRHRVIAGKDTMFREVAYINVSSSVVKKNQTTGDIVIDTSKSATSKPLLIPFAQFGIPRSVPIKAGFGESLNWDLTMNMFGEMGASKAGSTATGLGLSTLLGTAASGASAVLTEMRTADSSVDPQLQGEVARAQAQYNLANARQQLLTLCAKTYMPDVCP